MKRKISAILGMVLSAIMMSVPGYTDDINGYIIPEYYFNLSSPEDAAYNGHHGFWIRRIYFGYNTQLSDKFSARVRLEINSPAFEEGTMVPYVKDAFLKYKLGRGASLIFGITEPPSFNKIKNWWGFRFLEKTAPNLFKFASSRDFGIALDGKTKKGLVYTLMYGNYSSYKSEDNKGKCIYGRIGYQTQILFVEANGHIANDGSNNYTYFTFFGGLKNDRGRCGASFHYKNRKPGEGDGKNTSVLSAFGILKLRKKTEVILRYDHFLKKNLVDVGGYLPVASSHKARLLIAGFNLKVHKMIQICPNIKYIFYSGSGRPEADIWFNLTAKVSYKTKIGEK